MDVNPSISIPLAHGSVSIKDFLSGTDSSFVKTDKDGLISLVYSQNLLSQDIKEFITGPAAPIVGRLRNMYLMELMIKLPKEAGMSITYRKVIRNHINLLQGEKNYKSVVVVTDVDPL